MMIEVAGSSVKKTSAIAAMTSRTVSAFPLDVARSVRGHSGGRSLRS